MKRSAYVFFAFLIVLKLILVSVYMFGTELAPLFSGSDAVASEKTTTAGVKTDRPQTVPLHPGKATDSGTGELTLLLKQKAELKAQEEELAAVREEINGKIEELTRLRNEIKADLAKKDEADGQKFKQLIKAYSTIKPQKAAELIEKLDKDFSVELLSQMKGETVGAILSFLDREKAARIIEGLGGKQ